MTNDSAATMQSELRIARRMNRSAVAQISNLLYRRFLTCRACGELKALLIAKPLPIGNRRYSRLEICATSRPRPESHRRFMDSRLGFATAHRDHEPKAPASRTHSKRFARLWNVEMARQRLECVELAPAFWVRFMEGAGAREKISSSVILSSFGFRHS